MKKWKKILISLITVFVLTMLPAESAILPGTVCVTEAAPRISSSKLRQILTQKDASELANDTLDMAIPYWTDLLKGSGITLRSLGFSTTNKLFPKQIEHTRQQPLDITARGVVLSAASQPIPLILPDSFFNSSILSLSSAACSKFRSAAAARICFST